LKIISADASVPAAETIFNRNQAFWWDAARIIEDDFTFPLYEKAPAEQKHRKGKKNAVISSDKHGYYIHAVPADKDYTDIAPDATLRRAAVRQKGRGSGRSGEGRAILVKADDIMKKVRIRRNSSLIVFLMDLSWSMAVSRRMAATKKAITTILTKAYQFRDDVCLITFQKEGASLVIPPTHSVSLAERSMKKILIGGKTPLAAGLTEAYDVMKKEIPRYGRENIFLILLSDCEANVSFAGGEPQAEAEKAAERIACCGFRSIIINSDSMTFGQGYANNLAKHLNASCFLIDGLNAEHLIGAVRNELKD